RQNYARYDLSHSFHPIRLATAYRASVAAAIPMPASNAKSGSLASWYPASSPSTPHATRAPATYRRRMRATAPLIISSPLTEHREATHANRNLARDCPGARMAQMRSSCKPAAPTEPHQPSHVPCSDRLQHNNCGHYQDVEG